MALLMSIELNSGVNVQSAYIRIDTIIGSKVDLQIGVNSYISQKGFEEGLENLGQKFYRFEPSVDDGAPNFIKQGYEHLKTIPEYKNAIDI